MSFNNLGSYSLAPGESTWVGIAFNHSAPYGLNGGTQLVTPDPNNDGTPGMLQVSAFTKEIYYREYFENGQGDPNTAYWQYWSYITNIGNTYKNFTIQGGGLS